MPNERRRSLTDSLRRVLERGKDAPSNPQGTPAGKPPQPEPAAPPVGLRTLSLHEFLRYAHVLAADGDASALAEAQTEVGQRLIDAQEDADIASLHDASRRLERRRLQLEAEQEDGRLLGRPPRRRPPDDDRRFGAPRMCSLAAPDDESQPLGS
jgi:hypothetical protein